MNISFSITTPQVKSRIKTVTRRMGWRSLRAGAVLQAVEKAQGLKKGEHVVVICQIRVLSVVRERLDLMLAAPSYGAREVILEGFAGEEPGVFVERFCRSHKGCRPGSMINRIQFEYLDPDEPLAVAP